MTFLFTQGSGRLSGDFQALRSKFQLRFHMHLGNAFRCRAGGFESLAVYVSITRPRQNMFIKYKNLTEITIIEEQLLSEVLYLF